MSFEIKDKELAGRIGKLKTKSGVVETPAFFPVINPFRQEKDLPLSKIKDIGFNQVITNAFIIKQHLGDEALKIGIHKLLNYDGVIMTDSGAYQLLVYGFGKVKIDPRDIVLYQDRLGSDIAVIADIPTRDDAPYEEAKQSVEETLKRARMVIDIVEHSKTLWVLPIQGGIYTDLVARSAREALKIRGYSMYAIGSPVMVLEKYEFWKIVDMVATAKTILPPDKPVHLFGGGHPLIIPFMVALGIDSFDSASYILYAREGRYMTEHGTYRVTDLDYFPCECEVCSRYTPKELMELSPRERIRLIAIHNLHVISREIKRVKVAIREGRLWELLEERARTHPALREALNHIIKYIRWIEKLDPRVKGDVHGVFLYDSSSIFRPEILRHKIRLPKYVEKILPNVRHAILIPGSPIDKPLRYSLSVRELPNDVEELIGRSDVLTLFY
ncbi:MAG TPA: tRNA guanosine(15) transglycosylase TgtA, partial [Acidilobales archaeon]|nr:tRNA guanosine(15) transglycosylase TgtA [Acidilobales archaeon]